MTNKIFRYSLSAFLAALLLVGLVSCSEKKKKEKDVDLKDLPKMVLTKNDTVQVEKLATTFLEHLKSGHIDAAIDMLDYVDKDKKVVRLPDDMAKRQKAIFERFPCLKYRIDNIIFDREYDSQVRYTIEFFEKKPGDTRPNTTSFFIRLIRENNTWHLTMSDTNTNNAGQSEIEN